MECHYIRDGFGNIVNKIKFSGSIELNNLPEVTSSNYVLVPDANNKISYMSMSYISGPGDGWSNIYTGQYDSMIERGISICSARARSNFKRYPLDPDPERMVPTTSRVYRLEIGGPTSTANLGNSNGSVYAYYTYHSIPYTVSGTVSGYTGDGSGITVSIYRYVDNELVFLLTTGVGGTFSATWYDNTEELYAVARQSSTLLGRSDNALAT